MVHRTARERAEDQERKTGTSGASARAITMASSHLNDTCAGSALEEHQAFGQYRDSLYIVIPVTIVYALIFLTGIVGNVSTCIVIARNKSMHTATNYYLLSLAMSDLLLLVSGLPAEMYMVWCKYPYIFGESFCVLRGLAAETSTNASVLTIAAFTVERYVAICHPFLSQTLSKLSRAVKLILVIWLVALSFALPQALQFGVLRHRDNPNLVMCTVKRIIISHSFELSTFLFFALPMCLITVLYALIGLKLRRSDMMKNVPGSVESARNCRHHPGRSSRRVLKMLVAVVIAFFVCWAPFHVQRLLAIYGTSTEDHMTSKGPRMEFLYLLMTYVSGVLYYVSTTINPILYNIMSNKFRKAFMETLSRSCRFAGLPARHEQRSYYSSLSRSQQRTIGAYNSRTMATDRGSGIAADSTNGSGNSGHDATSQRQSPSDEPPSNGHCGIVESRESPAGEWRGSKRGKDRDSAARARCRTERRLRVTSDSDASGRKWWRLLKWLPGLKVLQFPGGRGPQVVEDRVLNEAMSMAMWNVRDGNRAV